MGIPDSSLLDLIEKVRSWISWRASDLSCLPGEFEMPQNGCKICCCECAAKFSESCNVYHCQSCGRWLCWKCCNDQRSSGVVVSSRESIKSCRFCDGIISARHGCGRKYCEKVHPSVSPRESPEPPSPSSSTKGESGQSDRLAHYLESRDCGNSPQAVTSRSKSMTSFSAHPSPISVCRSLSRSDEEEQEEPGKHIFNPYGEYYHDISDIDSSSVSARHEFYTSVESSPSDSPSRNNFTPYRVGHFVQRGQEGSPLAQNDCPLDREGMAVLKRPESRNEDPENTDSDDQSTFRDQYVNSHKPLDFEIMVLSGFPHRLMMKMLRRRVIFSPTMMMMMRLGTQVQCSHLVVAFLVCFQQRRSRMRVVRNLLELWFRGILGLLSRSYYVERVSEWGKRTVMRTGLT
ncbi:hypothetical protein LWI28_010555 [Acer negundo]|uniref:FYVE-type domain-containing protein n=1 Tax=Acer negundo TaxID=4023 RepID=A0AAD5NN51_ACENE|nr:hypothetical protein LWI28_010555 [Acer negundo]